MFCLFLFSISLIIPTPNKKKRKRDWNYLNKLFLHLHLAGENLTASLFHCIQSGYQVTALFCLGSKPLAEFSFNFVFAGRFCAAACYYVRRWIRGLCCFGTFRLSYCLPTKDSLSLTCQKLLVWTIVAFCSTGLWTLHFSRLRIKKQCSVFQTLIIDGYKCIFILNPA